MNLIKSRKKLRRVRKIIRKRMIQMMKKMNLQKLKKIEIRKRIRIRIRKIKMMRAIIKIVQKIMKVKMNLGVNLKIQK